MSEETTSDSQEPTAAETEARSQGWVPQEDFRGDTADWIDADTFVKRGREINPILRKNNERIQRELDATKRQMEELRKSTEEFKAFQKEAYDRKLGAYEEELRDLKHLKKKAISEADGDLVVEIDEKMDELKARKANEVPPTPTSPATSVDPQVQADIAEWMEINTWYKKDVNMETAANAIADRIRKSNPYLIGKEFLDEVDKGLTDIFSPEKLGKKTRPRSPTGGSGSTHTETRGGKQSYDSLPPEAKAACDKFVKQKLMTKEDYVSNYDWS